MSLLAVDRISKHFGAEEILAGVSFRVERGQHVALIGSNGAGKSTILRIIAGREEPDSGSVHVERGVRTAYLEQQPEFDEAHTLYDVLLDTFAATIAAQERLRELESDMAVGGGTAEQMEEYGRLQHEVEHTGYDYTERIERVLTGLGLPRSSWHQPVTKLSGGQRTRANLARTLLLDADLLLLDEPTNHLDIPAVEWLEGYLRELKRTFLIVAHDRYLLDRVTTRTLELSFHTVTEYDAAYSRFLVLRAERMERQQAEFEAQQKHIAKTEEFIRRYGAGQRYKEARGRQKRLDRLERIDRPREAETVRLRLGSAKRSGDIVLDARNLVAGYRDHPLVRLPGELVVRRGERVAIIGPNGSGKTTMLRTLMGALPPLSGTTRWGSNTTVGYYSQTLEGLVDRRTILEEVQAIRPMGEEEARGLLGRFLFSGDDVFKTVRTLSGGEKSRVALARLILEEPNVLVLDEPTNHLDIASRDALESVLEEFAGTLLFVSHDRYLIDSLAGELWVLHDGVLDRYHGGYSEYASGCAQPLDVQKKRDREPMERESPQERVRRLEAEAESLAARLGEAGTSASLGTLRELSDRYAEVLRDLEEAQGEWLDLVRAHLRASSGSPARSVAAKPR